MHATSLNRATAATRSLRPALLAPFSQEPALDLEHITDTIEKEKTVLYLAYGSNLCYETFQGKRGIKPLAQVNVVVPSLRLTFDLPGIPYIEPCFSNSALRTPTQDNEKHTVSEKAPLLANTADYHKDRWKKGLVGVVYEVTLADYKHIIATEGGGTAYKDVLVDCYPLLDVDVVPGHPTNQPFKAHTLFAPVQDGGRLKRPDPSYAQPSARYLKLITDGAEEHSLPQDYKDYLYDIRSYTITTKRQRFGQIVFATVWMPVFLLMINLQEAFQDKNGNSPKWAAAFAAAVINAAWASYDGVFKKIFGDGGLGFIAAGSDTSILEPNLREAHQQLTSQPIPRSNPQAVLPIGVGFINWGADLETSAALLGRYTPAAAWFFAPRQADDLRQWATAIREATQRRTSIWVQIGTVAEALAVTKACKPDVLVVQGTDAGGHGRERGAGVTALVPEVADAIAALRLPAGEAPALVATGGIAEGRGVAAALALGAEGVVMGTRFLACPEAAIAQGYRAEVVRASDGGATTARTKVYDQLRGTTDWPEGFNGRGVLNRSWQDAERGVALEENKRSYDEAVKLGDEGWGPEGRMTTYAGTAVGLVTKIMSAREIVEEAREGARQVIKRMGGKL
ncbi:FAR-17a/AIG1-like protein [Neofusicoccum parvum]|nr:FAR-17a/AIG1-like protein [Neofusicoccum parvum]